MTWDSIWTEVRKAVQESRSRAQALARVSVLREEPTTWDALARAWRRRRDKGCEVGSAEELLGSDTWGAGPIQQLKTQDSGAAKHLVIPDLQIKPGVPLDHLRWIGRYAVAKQPTLIIILGDTWDMPSLSAYEPPVRKAAKGLLKKADIESGNCGMEVLEEELDKGGWKGRKVLLMGNHDCFSPQGRIGRYLDEHPEDEGLIALEDFADYWLKWERVPFLQPIEIDGVLYCHLFPLNRDGDTTPFGLRRGARDAKLQVQAVGQTCTAGHKQGLDTHILVPPYGRTRRGLIAGSCYLHDEEYLGVKRYWRGVLLKHSVGPDNPNHYDLCEVPLSYLKQKWGP